MSVLQLRFVAIPFIFWWLASPLRADDLIALAMRRLEHAALVYDEPGMAAAVTNLVNFGAASHEILLAHLDHEDSNVRWQVVLTLDRIGKAADAVRLPLARMCHDRDADVRGASLLALLRLFPSSPETRLCVAELEDDPHELVRTHALYCRWQLDKQPSTISRLVAAAASKDWMTSEAAGRHLISIGRPSVSALISVAGQQQHPARLAVVRILGELRIDQAKVVETLTVALEAKELRLNVEAAKALGHLGPRGLPALGQLVQKGTPQQQLLAIRALSRAGTQAVGFLPALIDVAEKDERLRVAAINAMGSIGSGNAVWLARIAPFLVDQRADVRAAAASSIGAFGLSAGSYREQLRQIARADQKDFVRRAADRAIKQISE